jgi:hypothetical protein
MSVYYSDGSKGTTLYSRYLMKLHLGRELSKTETVDHINEDYTDDRIENFQILSLSDNSAKTSRLRFKITWYDFICPQCNKPARKNLRYVKHNWKQGKGGPYCGKKCSRQAQIGRSGSNQTICGTNAMYARGCRCAECKQAHAFVSNEWKKKQKRGRDGELDQPLLLESSVP